ncbi:MAG TPA: hypothetical protein VLC09_10585 [Polyangiaceae bacterium]|nr:hypothetical protein [Polyangiaceae bacterium]
MRQVRSVLGFVVAASLALGCSVYDDSLLDDGDEPDGSSGGGTGTGGQGLGGDGSGGGGGTGGGQGTGGLGGASNETYQLIDDMEDGNVQVRFIDGRTGGWDVAHDSASAGTQVPAQGFSSFDADSGAPDSNYAAHTQGTDLAWASLNVSMKTAAAEYDASAFQGLRFRAKASAASVKTVLVRVVTADTDPAGGVCGGANPACFDHFSTEVQLTTDWATHSIYFEDFAQQSPVYESVNLAKMYYFQFYFSSPAEFELWVDDIEFIEN